MQSVASRGVAAARPRRPKPRRRFPAEVLTDPEVRALLDASGGPYHPVALRNRALIALKYRAGHCVSEALDLFPNQVDAAKGIVRPRQHPATKASTKESKSTPVTNPSWSMSAARAP